MCLETHSSYLTSWCGLPQNDLSLLSVGRVCAWKPTLDSRSALSRHDFTVSAVAVRVVGQQLVMCSADSSGTLCSWAAVHNETDDLAEEQDADGGVELLHRCDGAHVGKVTAVGIQVRLPACLVFPPVCLPVCL